MDNLSTKTEDDETERTVTNTTEDLNDDQPSEIKQTSSEENKNIPKTNESNESPSTRFISASEMSDPTSNSSEGNNSASLSKNSYKRGPTPSVFRNITEKQCKKNLLEIIDNIEKGYEYQCKTKLTYSGSNEYYFYSSRYKISPNDRNYTICFDESDEYFDKKLIKALLPATYEHNQFTFENINCLNEKSIESLKFFSDYFIDICLEKILFLFIYIFPQKCNLIRKYRYKNIETLLKFIVAITEELKNTFFIYICNSILEDFDILYLCRNKLCLSIYFNKCIILNETKNFSDCELEQKFLLTNSVFYGKLHQNRVERGFYSKVINAISDICVLSSSICTDEITGCRVNMLDYLCITRKTRSL